MTDAFAAAAPVEGWHVQHLFYTLEYGQWSTLTADEQRRAKVNLTALVQEIRATPDTQLLTIAMVSPKADLGFMLVAADLHAAHAFEKRLSQALGADVLTPVYSCYSMTEPGEALHPDLPGWPVFSFCAMSLRRNPEQNWYALPLQHRAQLLTAQAQAVAQWKGRVFQLVTGSTGLDDGEWAISLFAQTPGEVKAMQSSLRLDPLNAHYAEFGEYYLGLQLPLDELFRRLLI